MLDGDPTTATFRTFVQRVGSPPGVGYTWTNSTWCAHQPHPLLPSPESEGGSPVDPDHGRATPEVETFGEDSFLDNFLAWYEIRTGDNSVVFAPDPLAVASPAACVERGFPAM